MANAIQLQQTLHGYGDGHQLLAGSLNLPREQQWQLLVMSDLSGHSFRAGFDSYLTGYPLDNGGYYCLARTWFAPELPRPGCVWTHTILISDTDLAQIQDFSSVLSHFRRPSSTEDFDDYKGVIDLNRADSSDSPKDWNNDVARILLSLLYGSPSQRIVLVSESSRPYEQLMVSVFNQQWPRLRRNFRFCTGALAIRDLNFDLAIAPSNALRQTGDEQNTITATGNDLKKAPDEVDEDWVRIAIEDLSRSPSQAALRRFLWRFGPDYGEGRNAFRPLCEIYLASSRSSESVDQILTATAHFFPDPDSSQRLKAELFGVGGSLSQVPGQGEPSVLMALVSHPAASSISSEVAAIEKRARSLAADDSPAAVRIALAAHSIGGLRGGQFLDGLAAGVRSNPKILRELPSYLTLDLLKRLPALLTSPEVWRGPAEHQLAVTAGISSLNGIAGMGGEITKAALSAGAWASLPNIFSQFGNDAVSSCLEWIDAMPEVLLSIPSQVSNALAAQRHRVTDAIHGKRFGARALRVASSFLDPRAERVQALGTRVWSALVGSGIQLSPPTVELRSKAFALSLGLALAGSGDAGLVREGFSAIYDAARDQQLGDELWGFVEPYLPWYVVTWDRCVRLVRGIVKLFLERQWPPSEFLLTFLTAEQFERAIDEADRTRAGSRYIRWLCSSIASSQEPIDQIRSRIIRPHCELPLQ